MRYLNQKGDNMEFYDLLRKRYSARKYLPKKVELSKLAHILEAARIAPTAKNLQPFKVIVCDNEESLGKLSKAANIYGAPMALLVCGDIEKAWHRDYDGKVSQDIDTAIITTHMMLEATNQGINSVWVCNFKPDVIRSEFSLPDNIVPEHILVVGYAVGEAPKLERFKEKRKKLEEIVSYNHL